MERNLKSLAFDWNEAGLFYFSAGMTPGLKMPRILLITIALLLVHLFWTPSDVSAEDCLSKFGISAKSVSQKLQQKQELILIDVRSSREFERLRIPGSLNMALFAIKTKAFLKSKALVLINEGHSRRPLEEESAVLSASGFKVSILNGGLFRWSQEGRPLEGDAFARRGLNKVSPQIFFSEQASGNWILIDISQSGKSIAYPGNFQRIRLPYTNNPDEFIPELKAAIRNHSGKGCPSVLICDDNGKRYEALEERVRQAGILNVLYLRGGLEEYKVFEQQQSGTLPGKTETSRRSVKTYRSCRSCP